MKKFIAVMCCVCSVFTMMAVNVAVGEPTKVSVWMHSGQEAERQVILKQAQDFNAGQNTYQVEVVELPEGSYTDQVNAAALAGNLPCLLDFDGPFLYNFAWSGYLQPLDQYVSQELRNDVLPSILAQGTYSGKLYSLGTFDSGLALWGNKAYLEKAGVRIPKGINDPWTLQEFEAALEALAKVENVKYPLDLKVNYGGEWPIYAFAPIIQSFGGDTIDRSTYQKSTGVLDGEKSVEALNHMQMWVEKGWVNPSQTTDDDFYGSKTSALALVGHWMYNVHKEALGDDLVLIPMPKFGEKSVTGMGSWNWGITATCSQPEGAWAFLEYLLKPEEITRMTDANGAIPGRKSALAQRADLYGEGGPLAVYAQQLATGVASPRPVTPAFTTISREFSRAVWDIFKGADVKNALSKVAQNIDQDIEDNAGYQVK